MRKRAADKVPVDRLLASAVNVLSLIHSHLYFPCHSNGLKEVGGMMGCTWSEPDASGLQSLVWRSRWEQTNAEVWKEKLLTYNQEDCAA
jgi:predicted RecB family nuclease